MSTNVRCPNCGRHIDPEHLAATRWPDMVHSNPNPGHGEGCILVAYLDTLGDRGHDLSGVDLSEIDAADLWTRFGGPATDAVAEELGLPAYPTEN